MQTTPNNSRFFLRSYAATQIQDAASSLSANNREKAVVWMADVLWTIEQLAEQSGLGVSFPMEEPRLHSLRRFRVRNHRVYWIYYRPFASGNGIEVFGVVHERQDAVAQLEASLES